LTATPPQAFSPQGFDRVFNVTPTHLVDNDDNDNNNNDDDNNNNNDNNNL
jgi:hypothetical protein